MFWKKKQDRVVAEPVVTAMKPGPKSKQDELEEAAKKLASSLRTYADASYAAQQVAPDEELKAAYRKVEIARKIVREGRIAHALGCCLPEHMSHWHAWSQRDDFMRWVKFDASNIVSTRATEEIGARRIEVTTNDFIFNDRHIASSSATADCRRLREMTPTAERSISTQARSALPSSISARI